MNIIKCNIIPIENLTNGITNVCRLCLDAKSIMKSLYNPLEEIFEENVTTLFHIMQKLSKTKLSNDPKYPSYLCLNCIALLNTAYKVNRLMEISQTQMKLYFNDETNLTKIDEAKYCGVDNVEIISNKGKYSLRDIIIVEDDNKAQSSFNGFLNNLGSEVSAGFVTKNYKKKLKEDKFYSVNLIPVKESTIQNQAIRLNENCNLPETDCTKLVHIVENTKNKTTHKATLILKGNVFRKQKTDCAKMKVKRTYLCQICGHIANGANSLNNHMKLEHDGRRFACEVCGRKYLSNSHLRYHMLKHKNERKYLCTVCGKNFNYSSSLEYHMRIHTGEKKYKCTYCDRSFTMSCALKRHLRTHTGLRPYNCSFCEKAFRSKGEVACHEMTHTGFRPYHCEFCGKGFTKTYNKKIHMLGHCGPFLCEFCQRGFVTISYLKLHMKVAHNVNDDAYILQSDDIDIQLEETLNAIE